MAQTLDTSPHSMTALAEALAELSPGSAVPPEALEPAGFSGMAHDHYRLRGKGLILRVPRVSQWGLAAEDNLAYQAAGFRRAAASGHTPRLEAVLPRHSALPMGALLVEEIAGEKPRLPRDLPAIVACLAAVHRLPMPEPKSRPPLLSPEHALAQMLETIERQAGFLDHAGLAPDAVRQLGEELEAARRSVAESPPAVEPKCLILTDSHPGNFVIQPSGKAYFVDLEKSMYALPAIDLAHATLYTSTRFDPEIDAVLGEAETLAFYRGYLAAIGRDAAAALGPWLAPARRLVWLRTMTWCVKWAVESQGSGGWSRRHLDARVRRHMEACLADFFSPRTIARLRAELAHFAAGELVP